MSYAFDSIPDDIKERLPGFDIKTYTKLKDLEGRLKKIVEKPLPNGFDAKVSELNVFSSKNSFSISSPIQKDADKVYDCDSQSMYSNKYPDKGYEYTESESILNDMKYNDRPDTSTPNYHNVQGPLKKAFPSLQTKKSLSLDVFSLCSDTSKLDNSNQSDTDIDSSNQNKKKGKFVPKKASLSGLNEKSTIGDVPSNTLSRLRNATEKLKPLPVEEKQTYQPVCHSSVEFQPPQLAFNKPCTLVSPIVKETIDTFRDKQQNGDENQSDIDGDSALFDDDDYVQVMQESNSVVNISDSLNDSLPNTQIVNGKEIPIDKEGWQQYREEDFLDIDDFDVPIDENSFSEPSTSKKPDTDAPEVVNLMEVSVVETKGAKYEGMGDFAAGTRNDGITGETLLYCVCYIIIFFALLEH